MIRNESEEYLRCLARNEVRGQYCGVMTCFGDGVTDRECVCCGKQDFHIEATRQRLLDEEKLIFDRIESRSMLNSGGDQC